MLTSTAQLIALTTYGNLFMRKAEGAYPLEFYPTNATFRPCKSVDFIYLKRGNNTLNECPFAPDPAVYLTRLMREGCQGLRLHYSTSGDKENYERRLSGQVGWGGRWLLETSNPGGSDYWESRWILLENKPGSGSKDGRRVQRARRLEDLLRLEDSAALGGVSRLNKGETTAVIQEKIWQVTYCRIATGVTTHRPGQLDMERLRQALSANLENIAQFARLKGLGQFAGSFETALARLDPDIPLDESSYLDFTPPDLIPMDACRLLAAVDAAWVFGGVGSWNDLNFEGKDRADYESLSETLYQVLNACILASANASCRL